MENQVLTEPDSPIPLLQKQETRIGHTPPKYRSEGKTKAGLYRARCHTHTGYTENDRPLCKLQGISQIESQKRQIWQAGSVFCF